ncbi:esterase family protein [Dyadobacter sp. CY323]|uniref:alpha/beta hydrolase n=1 Tax=Dyadobacter sp. CY323 TaxID=2907302 RepID=UPI001F3254EC|nr:alpha/beta hydrolase-fold protein [Dyadobacter sp. CY323]MCE6987887.1 esterase family protein [Dyadobacter sp. CY323]
MSLIRSILSAFLHREVTLSVLLPIDYNPSETYPLQLFNDGQDFDALMLADTLKTLQSTQQIAQAVVVGIHANSDRISEYGVAAKPDYAGRGDKAHATTAFVLRELLPFLKQEYHVATTGITFAGFSLGGLMALDVVWNHPQIFTNAGVFSGALWWRQKALTDGYSDSDRIMHNQIRNSDAKPGLKFWFQCGTLDEHDDRDGDGVIDSIQDTLECISALERKGYGWGKDVFYTEIPNGHHNPETWSAILPEFLKWASKVS